MGYNLVIVESPAKTGSFEKILGPGYKCLASFGHIRELKGLKDIDVQKDYKLSFTTSGSKMKQIRKLKDAASKAEVVYLATDDDREGEAIAWHLCKVLGLKVADTPRMIFNEITPDAILSAVRNPSLIDMNKVYAQQARQTLDVLVGFRISPYLWKRFGGQLSLSAGRCQTPALRLVYENEKVIEQSPGQVLYTTTGYFTSKTIPFVLNHQHDDKDKMAAFLETTVEDDFEHILTIGKQGTTTKNPPKPFTTSSMQQAANSEFRISPKEAMSICQKLYEGGHITYMRTDSRTYSKDFIGTARKFITDTYGAKYVSPNIDALASRSGDAPSKTKTTSKAKAKAKTKTKSDSAKEEKSQAQEAHEAIRPTKIAIKEISSEKYSPRERKIYHMIWRNATESCMIACTAATLSASITAPEEHAYKASQEEIVEPGWKIVAGYEKQNAIFRYLSGLGASCPMKVDYSRISSKLGLKDSKSHYTEAKLVQLLEEKGIGRPSTFSSLIDKIQQRGYVKRDDVEGKDFSGVEFDLVGEELTESNVTKKFGGEKNKLVLQPLGRMVWEFLGEHCLTLFEYDFTKQMEDKLDEIAKGETSLVELCGECDRTISECVNELPSETDREIPIDDTHVYTNTKYGPAVASVVNGKKVYKSARKDVDLDALRRGELTVDEVIDQSKIEGGTVLGEYEGKKVILKNGKFGLYVTWNDKNISVKKLGKRESYITFDKVLPLLAESQETKSFRSLNKDYSVRVGKTPYVFHKTPQMTKPKFLHLKGFDEDPFTCDSEVLWAWLETTHKVKQDA